MGPKAAKKEARVSATEKRREAQEKRALKAKADQEALAQWIDTHDTLLDKAADTPIQLEELFTSKLVHRTFPQPGVGDTPYDWSDFRKVLEERTATSPRWFIQLREEDLLAGADGMEGVTVDCYVIAEATQPTLAPAEYIVKVHWPYSDAEDNAPERILPLESQGMCWRRVVKADGSDMNVFLLQKRSDGAAKTGAPVASSAFGFGASAAPGVDAAAPAVAAAPPGFGFGFGTTSAATNAAPAAAPASFGFGFGTAAPTAGSGSSATPAFSFGFGQSSAAPAAPAPVSFGFGAPSAPTSTPTAAPVATAPAPVETGEVKVEPIKTSEILFALWSRKRLTELAKEIRSGSRIVRGGFALDGAMKMKLVMQNDRKDDVVATTRRLMLTRIFAKQDDDVKAMDKWIDDCPVYDEILAPALQAFRERQLLELASDSEDFQKVYEAFHEKIEKELQRIVEVRLAAADAELGRIAAITELIKEHKLAEKNTFRLLKFYAKNDVMPFRPYGKISGISEMGESADVCVPPAHVNINPFTGKRL